MAEPFKNLVNPTCIASLLLLLLPASAARADDDTDTQPDDDETVEETQDQEALFREAYEDDDASTPPPKEPPTDETTLDPELLREENETTPDLDRGRGFAAPARSPQQQYGGSLGMYGSDGGESAPGLRGFWSVLPADGLAYGVDVTLGPGSTDAFPVLVHAIVRGGWAFGWTFRNQLRRIDGYVWVYNGQYSEMKPRGPRIGDRWVRLSVSPEIAPVLTNWSPSCGGDLRVGARAGVRLFWADPGRWLQRQHHSPAGRLLTRSLADVSFGLEHAGGLGGYVDASWGLLGFLVMGRMSADVDGGMALSLELGAGAAPTQDLGRSETKWR